ncbi:ATP-binding domain 1 family protein [Besnoitia besnoiti]|uniref:GPN-loop GTPase 3 n=1 Tax=Besnoitia besnoiti TaxID=94643 RepID=A0A2A9MGB8_BESBE|nr:ATP-binding domain 1 family protein [Besnoitia besnoiti]PFH34647.1 ATP-binding domain 1 family protein [Besnoitia besnoiti]
MKFGLLVIGPAGSGKSTFCYYLHQHMQVLRRHCRLVNLDPAAEYFAYQPDIDIRDLVTVQDVEDELHLGPNGALVFAMEFLQQRIDWLETQFADFGEDELFILDCPGQVELYTHLALMAEICNSMQAWGLRLCACCCLDVSFMTDSAKLLGGSLMALSAMVQLELPHINLLTKCDLVDKNLSLMPSRKSRAAGRRRRPERADEHAEGDFDSEDEPEDETEADEANSSTSRSFGLSALAAWPDYGDEPTDAKEAAIDALLSRDPHQIVQQLDECMPAKYKALNAAFATLVEDYGLVSYLPCNVLDEESLAVVTSALDHALQYGEDLEVRESDVIGNAEGA